MNLIYNKLFLEHDTGMHPENRQRLEALKNLKDIPINSGEKYLTLVHTLDYIEQVKRACERATPLDSDTLTSQRSYEVAVHAVGAVVMASETDNFAVVRPPGHHAYPSRASGFCIFNNIAIATQKLVAEGKRVLIFDFDGHCGDGTSHIFYDSDKVLFWSLHQYPAFPGTGKVDETGTGKGRGYTLNMPLPPKSGDDVFMEAVRTFLPVAEQFEPDVVAVSAGFDAHQSDYLLDLNLTVNSYYQIGQLLTTRFKRIFATLEGGYHIKMLPLCLTNFVSGINGDEIPHSEALTHTNRQIYNMYKKNSQKLKKNLLEHWKF